MEITKESIKSTVDNAKALRYLIIGNYTAFSDDTEEYITKKNAEIIVNYE